MWPMLLDMGKGDCKRMLRRLELEAYCSIVSAFRAQGELNKSKKKVLNDLQNILSISTERHRAEIRRAVNDEKLETIADTIAGPNTASDWLIEGRRLIPLMPRLVPQTAFTATANQVANAQAEKNACMPSPSQTGNKDLTLSSPTTPINGGGGGQSKSTRPTSPNSNVVVLPSGMSIHIKGGLNTEDEEEPPRKRRRSQSTENLISPSASTQTPRVTYTTTASSTIPGVSPMKITISKSPQSAMASQSQKVILVTSAGQTTSPSILHKSITVPVVKTTSSNINQNKTSVILPNTSVASNGNLGNIVTVATQSLQSSSTSSVGTSTMTFLTPTVSIPRPRTKATIPRQRFPQVTHGQQKPGVVIPMGPQPVQPTPQTVQNIQIKQLDQSGGQPRGQNIQIKPVSKSTSTIQIRQEGGMKIITQSVPGAGGSKILPRPSQLTTASGTPVVVVSAGSAVTTATNVTMVSRPITSIGQPGTKILNISTQGGKIISTGTSRTPNIVTVNPKTLHLTAVKSGSGHTTGKPNVIVVQKTQPKRSGTPTGQSTTKTSTVVSSPFEKELMNFLQKQDSTKHMIVNTPGGPGQRPVERKVIVTTPGQLEASRQKAKLDAENRTSSLLAELIQAAGIVPDGSGEGSGDVTINLDEATMAALGVQSTDSQNKAGTSQSLPNNEWFEYDVTDDNNQTFQTTDTESPKVTVQRSTSVDLSQLTDQLSSQQFYTIEQAMKILNQPEKAEQQEATELSHLTQDGGEVTTEMESLPGESSDVTPEVASSLQSSSASTSSLQSQDIENLQEESQFTENPKSTAEIVKTSVTMPTVTSSQNSENAQKLGLSGELDPQTGIFYTVSTSGQDGATETTHVTVETTQGAAAKTFDLLSSSLAQAQIDLDPYQFVEEDVLTSKLQAAESQGQIVEVSSVTGEITEEAPIQEEVKEQEVESEVTEIEVKPSKFIPLQDVNKSTINVTQEQIESVVPDLTFSQDEVVLSHEDVSDLNDVQIAMDADSLQGNMSAVAIETAHSIDPTDVQQEMVALEDFGESASAGASSSSESQGDASSDAANLVRLSKRKRKPPSSIEDSPTQSVGGWTRACLGLIQRVSRYRGLNREKGDLNAASWFTEPVDPAYAPDYYSIVKNPMDFGTIKKKLESGSYGDHEEFHSDMLLVRDNCRLYNPPGSVVRRDCDEVFAFYMSEYEKILERWQKVHVSSPSSKKLKFDRSPVRS